VMDGALCVVRMCEHARVVRGDADHPLVLNVQHRVCVCTHVQHKGCACTRARVGVCVCAYVCTCHPFQCIRDLRVCVAFANTRLEKYLWAVMHFFFSLHPCRWSVCWRI